MELQEGQAPKLLAVRRSIMREVGALIAVRTSLLARLQVRPACPLPATHVYVATSNSHGFRV